MECKCETRGAWAPIADPDAAQQWRDGHTCEVEYCELGCWRDCPRECHAPRGINART